MIINAAVAKLDLHIVGIEPVHAGASLAFSDGKNDRRKGRYAPGSIAPRFQREYEAGYGRKVKMYILDGARPNDKQRDVIKKAFLDDGVSADVRPWKDTDEVYVEVTDGEPGCGTYIDEEGRYVLPAIGGGIARVPYEEMI